MPKFKPPTEHEEQTLLFKWIDETKEMQTDKRRRLALKWSHAIPNGYHKSMGQRMKAKREGVKSGILDVAIPCPELKAGTSLRSSNYHGLYIEMKRRGEKPSDTQEEFMSYLSLVGYKHALCYDWNSAARLIVAHLGLTEFVDIPEETEYERIKRLFAESERRRKARLAKPVKPRKERKKPVE